MERRETGTASHHIKPKPTGGDHAMAEYLRFNSRDRSIRLPDCNLRRIDLNMAYLPGANFSGSDLRGAELSHTALTGASFVRANLSEANLSEALLFRADFNSANLSGAILAQASLVAARLNCDLRDARLNGADLRGVQFLDASTLEGAEFSGAYLQDSQRDTIAVNNATDIDRIDWYPYQEPIPSYDPRPFSPTPSQILPEEYWERRPREWRQPIARES
jgi:hypothetical protein